MELTSTIGALADSRPTFCAAARSVAGGSFSVSSIARDDCAWVFIQGEVDLQGAPYLERELAAEGVAGAHDVVLHLERVRFIDLAGLAPIVRFALAGHSGRRVTLTDGSRSVRRLLELAGLTAQLNLVSAGAAQPALP